MSRGPGRPRRRPVELERRLVLDAARRTFAERGLEGASVETIARRAGVARPSIYEQFGSKDSLLAATVEDAAGLLVERLAGAFAAEQDVPWRDVVRNSYAVVFELTRDHTDAITVLVLAERNTTLPPGSGMADARQRVVAELAARGRERWARFGVEVTLAAEIVALMLFTMGDAVARRQIAGDLDDGPLIDLLTAFTVGGLQALGRDDFGLLRAVDQLG